MKHAAITAALLIGVAAAAIFATRALAPCSLATFKLDVLDYGACAASLKASVAAQEQHPFAPAVTVEIAAMQQFTERLFVSGTVVAREEAMIGSPLEGLRLTEILAEEGDHVAKGQVLARLDRSQLDALAAQSDAAMERANAAIAQASSQIEQFQATLVQAGADLERSKRLGAQIVAESTLDQRIAAQRVAQAQLAAGQSALRAAQADKASRAAERRELMVRLDRADIKAPVDGIVSRRTARLGAVASGAGEALFRIIVGGDLDLEADVPEQSIARVTTGLPASIRLAGAQKDSPGAVRMISAEVDKASRLAKIRIALTDASARPGAFASGNLILSQADGVGISASALQMIAGETFVQTVANDHVVETKVTTGVSEGERIQITQGLAPGDSVVARAAAFLRPGDLVRPLAPVAAAALAKEASAQ